MPWGITAAALMSPISPSGNMRFPSLAIAAITACAVLACGALGRRFGTRAVAIAGEVLILVALPVWGLALNHALPSCEHDACSGIYRPLAEPEIVGVYVTHAVGVLAYVIARRRRERLRGRLEPLVAGALLAAAVVDLVVALHFAPINAAFGAPALALLFPVLAMPTVAPGIAAFLFVRAAWLRVRRRGEEALEARAPGVAAGLWAALLVGVHALAHALVFGEAAGALRVFTRACVGLFAEMHPPDGVDCHYLCTVAARGHGWLVRPERLGRRRGALILVNRQLATANAFEDLLHERWPRFGRLARRIYDRVGLPISRLIRWRLASDLVYLAMKPAEWLFYLALLLLDRGSPEERLARMYPLDGEGAGGAPGTGTGTGRRVTGSGSGSFVHDARALHTRARA